MRRVREQLTSKGGQNQTPRQSTPTEGARGLDGASLWGQDRAVSGEGACSVPLLTRDDHATAPTARLKTAL